MLISHPSMPPSKHVRLNNHEKEQKKLLFEKSVDTVMQDEFP
jgi:hypothetical protein